MIACMRECMYAGNRSNTQGRCARPSHKSMLPHAPSPPQHPGEKTLYIETLQCLCARGEPTARHFGNVQARAKARSFRYSVVYQKSLIHVTLLRFKYWSCPSSHRYGPGASTPRHPAPCPTACFLTLSVRPKMYRHHNRACAQGASAKSGTMDICRLGPKGAKARSFRHSELYQKSL
jgi:hypothetical protein